MSLLLPDPIFKGINSAVSRKAIKGILDELGPYSRYVIPCAGQFTAAEALVDFGVKPTEIHTSDISLFSSTLGHLLDTSKTITDLGFTMQDSDLMNLIMSLDVDHSSVSQAAAILYALKWSQFDTRKEFYRWQRIEFEAQAVRIFNQYKESLSLLAQKLGGLQYEQRDAIEHLSHEIDNGDTLIWYHPPWYKNGYKKMFKSEGLYSWEEPPIPELNPADGYAFFDILREATATVVTHVNEEMMEKHDFSGWHTTLVDRKANGAREFLLSNKATNDNKLVRTKIKEVPDKVYPVYDDHLLTEASTIDIIPVTKELAMYYYDLFIKGLGMPGAEVYCLMVVDNQVMGVTGLHLRHWRTRRLADFMDVFCVTMQSSRYPKLGELASRLLTSRPWADKIAQESFPALAFPPSFKHYQTTFLTPHPSMKKVRNFMKLVERKDMPNNMFKLIYRCPMIEKTLSEIFHGWRIKQH